MKYKFSVLAVWLIAFNYACQHPVQNEIVPVSRYLIADTVCGLFFQDPVIEVIRNGQLYKIDPTQSQGAVILKNGHLFIVNPLNAGEMFIYNIQTKQMDEIQTRHPAYFSTDDAIKYADVLSQHLPLSFYHFYIDRYFHFTLEDNKVKLTRQNLRNTRRRINKAIQISENKYVTLGFFHAGLLGLCDKELNEMTFYGHYPIRVKIPSKSSEMEKIVVNFQGNIAWSDQHSKVVYGSTNYAYLSCYQFTGEKLKFQWEKHIIPPPATRIVDGFPVSDNTVAQGGFSDVAIAGDYVFACYTQRNVSDLISEFTHSILVYDMTGNLMATFQIDYPISNMMIDEEEGSVYGILRGEGERFPLIVRFQFNQI